MNREEKLAQLARLQIVKEAADLAIEAAGHVSESDLEANGLGYDIVLLGWLLDDEVADPNLVESREGIDREAKWRGIRLAATLTTPTNYGPFPDSVREIRRATLTMLANLDLGISEADSGGGDDTEFNIPYVRMAGAERAFAELGEALEQLKADASATVAR